MAAEFKIPDLGENVETGEVISVLVKEGQTIAANDPVIELETGKATIEVPSDVGGVIANLHVQPGDTVKPGQTVLTIDTDAALKEEEPPKAEAAEKEEPTEDTPKPEEQESARPAATEKKPATPKQDARAAPTTTSPLSDDRPPVPAAPSVRKFAREVGVNISHVSGTGPSGRISMEDVKAHTKQLLSQSGGGGITTPGAVPVPPLPDFTKWGDVERQAMNNVRKMTAQHMARCWGAIPHVTQHDKADITDLENMRKRYAKKAEEAGGKLTLTAMLLKIVASALKVYPQFNASVDIGAEEIVFKKYIHVGIAVDTPKGLMVPVVRDADKKNIIELSVELTEMAKKTRDGKVASADMQGGTFTISNLGGIGGGFFTPIVNHPEVAILGVGRGAVESIYNSDTFTPRLMLPLSLSYDHRVIDGADGARFLRWIAEAIQEPLLVALEG